MSRSNRVGRLIGAVVLIALFAGSATAAAAEELESFVGKPVRLVTGGRESYTGRLYAVLDDRVELVLADGEIIQILAEEIVDIEAIDPEAGRRGLFQDAAANRLMVMPTGFPMEKGEFHVTDQEIMVVSGSYGVADFFSVWGGISIPGFVLSGRFGFHVTPTIGASAGVFAGVEWVDGSALLLPYALASFGSPDRNLTVGGAAVYSTTRTGFSGVVAALGGKIVLTPTSALVSENWLIWDLAEGVYYPSLTVLGVAFRIAGNRVSWDIGAVVPLFVGETFDSPGTIGIRGVFGDAIIPLPLISLTYRID